ncbi:MAG TPA: lysophospholipid acyltransferase family protein [Longimicrobiales bacterium]
MILYRLCQAIVRAGWPLIGPLDVRGLGNVPADGPFLLVANHQSILDPILIQTVCPRPIHTMAKSTQFASPFFAWLMPRLLSFPVRRYQVDPQAVRIALRHLGAGRAVGIYVEGERSWDGRLQPPRLGTIRLVLKAGVPVVPCGISGSYDVWPRWGRGPRRAPVRISFGAPLRFPQYDRRGDRDAVLPEVADRIMRALADEIAPTENIRDVVPAG